MANELLQLVADLIGSRKKRAKFNRDPGKMMKKYGLPKESCDCLYTMDPKAIGTRITDELGGFVFEKDEFPACKHKKRIFAESRYPGPDPKLFAILPDQVSSGAPVEVVVWGQSFPRGKGPNGKELELELEPTGNAPKLDFEQQLEGTYRCCQIRARLEQPQRGVYKVRVNSRIGYLPPDGDFTLTVT